MSLEQDTITREEIAAFTRQLGAMLDADVNVLRALRIASQHTGNPALIQEAGDIARRLEDGRELHEALNRRPDLFDPFYVEMARQGEADGQLGKALLSVADYLDHSATAKAEPTPTVGQVRVGDERVGAQVLATLAEIALGSGAVWSVSAAGFLPAAWLAPVLLIWSGACLMSGAKALRPEKTDADELPAAEVTPAPLPPKSRERRVAETEAVVRNALMEQDEEAERLPPPAGEPEPRVTFSEPDGPRPDANGHPPEVDPRLLKPEPDPPKFNL
jgi:hypothetical protein